MIDLTFYIYPVVIYQKILENLCNIYYRPHIVLMDGEKGILKITLNWSKFIKYRRRDLLMGNKWCKYCNFVNIPQFPQHKNTY